MNTMGMRDSERLGVTKEEVSYIPMYDNRTMKSVEFVPRKEKAGRRVDGEDGFDPEIWCTCIEISQ
jgi:hypothetical protein